MRGFKDKLGLGLSWHSVQTADKCKPMEQGSADFVEASNLATN